jgi:CheY-like chemotaxis protein
MEKKKILVVDDMPPILSMLKLLLRAEYQIFPVSSGKEAMALLERSDMKMDLILLDVDMPAMSGFELLKKLKSDPKLWNLPVIMLTGHADQDTVIRAAQAGATDYIVKPFTEEILKKKLRSLLK